MPELGISYSEPNPNPPMTSGERCRNFTLIEMQNWELYHRLLGLYDKEITIKLLTNIVCGYVNDKCGLNLRGYDKNFQLFWGLLKDYAFNNGDNNIYNVVSDSNNSSIVHFYNEGDEELLTLELPFKLF